MSMSIIRKAGQYTWFTLTYLPRGITKIMPNELMAIGQAFTHPEVAARVAKLERCGP
eukprot:NODE_3316_length_788_cov_40.079838_g2773_i0.p3 GENE.NODE_3316_length_788_cov_40.079838_g2773_i0~~NODE_3316_length_788_cov_40.079838_g2773_i0.p3  ORF type:complete len:57 (+),score=8.56 NODE_3316_length_788_cov_40.079838_g2773_i0:60-230(+)